MNSGPPPKKLFWVAKSFWPVLGNFWLWSGNFSLYMKIIPFITQMTKKSGLLNISGVCVEISSMCPEMRIVHKDYVYYFHPMTKNF